ncbi:MAG: DUF892 family protein, partial [Sphingobacteriales bacterium]
ITLAKTNGQEEIANLLAPTLDEEKETDAVLSSIAESGINEEAGEETPESIQGQQTPDQQEAREIVRQEVLGREDNLADSSNEGQPTLQVSSGMQESEPVGGQQALAAAEAMNTTKASGSRKKASSTNAGSTNAQATDGADDSSAKGKKGKGKSKSKI